MEKDNAMIVLHSFFTAIIYKNTKLIVYGVTAVQKRFIFGRADGFTNRVLAPKSHSFKYMIYKAKYCWPQ